jgi:SPP1 gp7 family putative phage head morphogenesis protein
VATSKTTLRHARQIRVVIDDSVEQALADLVKQWGVAWDAVADEWRAAVAELSAARVDGRWPSRTVILRNARVQAAMQITSGKLDELSRNAGIRIVQGIPDLLTAQEDALLNLITSQVPDSVTVDWARVSDRQLEAIVKRTTRQVESSLRPLPRDVSATMKQELIRGVATGTNPNRVADLLIKRFGARFDGGLWRARGLARTEMLDATRDAALESRKANRAVLDGWTWLCALSARTCPSCLAMNGREFGVDEPGPDDHQCGRCTAVPRVKSWKELGIDAPEPVSQFPDAQAWFGQQTPKVQQQIMGDKRLAALNSGKLNWDQIPVQRQNPGWRRSFVPAAA